MSNHQEQAEPQPPAILYLSVIAAIAVTLHFLINFAAQPWGWPEGSVEQSEGHHNTH